VREALQQFEALNGAVLSVTPEPATMQKCFSLIGGIDAYIVEVPKTAFGKQFARDLPSVLPNCRSVQFPAPGAAAAWAKRFRRKESRPAAIVVVGAGVVPARSGVESYLSLEPEDFSREVLEAIASSDAVVGPDSWQTVFAELAGVRVVRTLEELGKIAGSTR